MALQLPAICLGGNVFGWTADEAESLAILDAARHAGLTFIDTADVYSAWANGGVGGQSESIIGRWLAQRPGAREEVLIATKVGKEPALAGIRPATLRTALDASLQRLGVDHVDLYYLHDDDGGPLTEVLVQLDLFEAAGKVRAIGLSNFSAARIEEALAICDREQLVRPEVLQPEYSLVARDIERDLVPLALREGLRIAPYFSLAGGYLTGKYRPGEAVDSRRADRMADRLRVYLSEPRTIALLDLLDEIAAARGVPVAAVALAWLRGRPAVASPIASARTAAQLGPLVEALTLELSTVEATALTVASDGIPQLP